VVTTLDIYESCNSGEKRRQDIHTPNSHVPAPRLPPAVGSGLLSSFRACLLAGVLARLLPAYCVLSCLPACFALARPLGCFLLRLRAGLLAALVLRLSFLACLLRLPAGLLAALLACCPSCLPACSTRLAVLLIAARSLGLDGASVRAMGWGC
jgi:hypothetical protein